MKGIGGNALVELQTSSQTDNEIGERIHTWKTVQTLRGWIDFMSGEAKRTVYNSKIEESTHVFVGDFVPLDSRITSESARLLFEGRVYDITFIDNPMGLKKGSQLEIYLKYTGGQ